MKQILIVMIYQLFIRPIVWGKDKVQVDFGVKLGVSIKKGYGRINTLIWEPYNEGTDFKKQGEAYIKLNGFYLEVAQRYICLDSWIDSFFKVKIQLFDSNCHAIIKRFKCD